MFLTGLKTALLFSLFSSLAFANPVANEPEKDTSGISTSCRKPTNAEFVNAANLGSQVVFKLNELNNIHKRKTGRELKVVVIARAGQDQGKTKVLKDFNAQNQLISIDTIARLAQQQSFSHGDSQDVNRMRKDFVLQNFSETNPNRNLKFSHLAFAINNGNKEPAIAWQTYHLLKPCEVKRPTLHQGGIGWFFSDEPFELTARIMLLPEDVQHRIARAVLDKQRAADFLADTYKLASSYRNERSLNTQNSNTWPLEVLAEGLSEKTLRDRLEAVEYLKATGYRPTILALGGKHATGAKMAWGRATSWVLPDYMRIDTNDHPHAAGPLELIEGHTVLAVEEYLARRLQNKLQIVDVKLPAELIVKEDKKSNQSGSPDPVYGQ